MALFFFPRRFLLLLLLVFGFGSTTTDALAPPPINLKREVLEIRGDLYQIDHWQENGKEKFSMKKVPRVNFWNGKGPPPPEAAIVLGGDQPFEIGDKVYHINKIKLGLGVVVNIQPVFPSHYLWWVTAEFLTSKGWTPVSAFHTKFRKGYTEEQ